MVTTQGSWHRNFPLRRLLMPFPISTAPIKITMAATTHSNSSNKASHSSSTTQCSRHPRICQDTHPIRTTLSLLVTQYRRTQGCTTRVCPACTDYIVPSCQGTTLTMVSTRQGVLWRACTTVWWVGLQPEVTTRHRLVVRAEAKRVPATTVWWEQLLCYFQTKNCKKFLCGFLGKKILLSSDFVEFRDL